MSDEPIDPLQFIKRLAPEEIGKFEPVSGMMLINIPVAEFSAMEARYTTDQCMSSDIDTLRAINHEIYHFAQTIASGYMYDRHLRLFNMIKPTKQSDLLKRNTSFIKEMPVKTVLQKRAKNTINLVYEMDRLSKLTENAKPSDHSLAGAVFPHFFEYQDQVTASEAEPNADGLSIIALIEGSAVVHAELLLSGIDGVCDRIEAQLATLPPVYRVLIDLTTQRYGDRAIELLLPTATLALRYTRPHEAYLPLLDLMADNPRDNPLLCGRALSDNLPEIDDAGPIIGTAINLYESTEKYQVYASVLRDLAEEKWFVDSYSLLADPSAMNLIQSFPIGFVTQDWVGGAIDKIELSARLIIMSIVLRKKSRSRDEREFEKAIISLFQ